MENQNVYICSGTQVKVFRCCLYIACLPRAKYHGANHVPWVYDMLPWMSSPMTSAREEPLKRGVIIFDLI